MANATKPAGDPAPASPPGPLGDLVVVEMGALIAGPFCGQVLGDFGAEVIKIEDPGKGDPMRQWGRSLPKGHSPWWPVIGRNKKSVTLNLRSAEGQQIARTLIGKADVLVENFRPGSMEKWGLSYETLSKDNPGLILARVSGFGQTGPMSSRAGYALIGEAMGGLRYITGEPDRSPARAGISIGDSLSGIHAAMGVLMALHARERTGKGQVVDVSIYESVLAVMENLITEYDLTGYVRERSGSILPGIAPSNAYPTKGGELVVIGANQDTLWARLAEAMGRPELATDPRYATHNARGENQKALDQLIGAWTSTLSTGEVLKLMDQYGIAAGRVFRAPDMLEDPQFAARDDIVELPHPVFGSVKMQNAFPKMSDTPGGVRWPGPGLGEHTDQVLRDVAGLDEGQIARLRSEKVI
ncbi:MAG TPA: CaiB/BaiF CoA-transferase family protein [Caulobacteraceae bacterium]|nr:CaiB/BaiF CoA-transferase family protein [Caulobacteraceae bacterium]